MTDWNKNGKLTALIIVCLLINFQQETFSRRLLTFNEKRNIAK